MMKLYWNTCRNRLMCMVMLSAFISIVLFLFILQDQTTTSHASEHDMAIETLPIPPITTYEKPQLVIGILSAIDNRDLRIAHRETWISSLNFSDCPFNISYKFLLDEPTVDSEKENDRFKDILYLSIMNSGKTESKSEKIYVWYKYIYCTYPDTILSLNMEDDLYMCVQKMIDRLEILQSKRLFYGFSYKGLINNTGDLTFVVSGKDIIDRIRERMFCYKSNECDPKQDLVANDGTFAKMRKWIDKYGDIDRLRDNDNLIARSEKAFSDDMSVCNKWILYHKATIDIIRKIHGYSPFDTYKN